MTERGSDIEFDFFDDEPETQEATQRRRMRVPPRGPRGPRRPRPAAGLTPLLRLLGLIAFAILLVVLLVFWVQSCRGASKRDSYESYMEKVRNIASTSEQTGRELNDLLTTPGQKAKEIQAKLGNFAQQEQQNLTQAESIAAPGPLRPEQEHVVEALQFRVSGLRGLASAFAKGSTVANTATGGSVLAAEAQRLVASDVVWDDLFKDPTRAELERQGIQGVDVPDSNFVQNEDLPSSRSMQLVLQRVKGASTGGVPAGLHGSGLVSVRAMPEGITLQPGTDQKVTSSTDLAIEVTIENTGEHQEVRVPVTLTIDTRPQPLVKRKFVDIIDPGQTKTVTFDGLSEDISTAIGLKSTVKAEIGAVKGETKLNNNSASYTVFFSID